MYKRVLSVLLGSLMAAPAMVFPASAGDASIAVDGNIFKITTLPDFECGALSNLEPVSDIGDGALRLKKGQTDGEYLSAIYTVSEYNDLVASWNSDTPQGTWIEVSARAYIEAYDGFKDSKGKAHDGWTDWMSWGKWSTRIDRRCTDDRDTQERQDSKKDDGWAYSYSKEGWGDSSINIRGTYTSTKVQLKVRFHADSDAAAMPVLRLLAATYKNTNDELWTEKCTYAESVVPEAESMALPVPAISQMVRDPDYGNVICSATSITMLLDGRGEDLLPEDLALIGYDSGFGGNGNWSFTVATAGAYGYESYVQYADFKTLRQEITKGYGVSLSVFYSKDKDGKYPYLENAPCNTGGHLITIVGYRFDKELNEYVYLANDPAAKSDFEVTHREYRESQLDKAWYRRATYFVHDKEANAGAYARDKASAKLLPVSGRTDEYVIMTAGKPLAISADFLKGKRSAFGQHGTLMYTISGEQAQVSDKVRRVTANNIFHYDNISVTDEGYIELPQGTAEKVLNAGNTLTLYAVYNSGSMYTAVATKGDGEFVPAKAKIPAASSGMTVPLVPEKAPATRKPLIIGAVAATVATLAGAVAVIIHKKRR